MTRAYVCMKISEYPLLGPDSADTLAEVIKGSLTVWALYAYFSDSQNAALSVWCGACSISAIGESNGNSQLAKYFRNSYALERYGG